MKNSFTCALCVSMKYQERLVLKAQNTITAEALKRRENAEQYFCKWG